MAHVHEKIDFTVEVFIVFNGKVLLRKHDKYNKWLGVGGHIELDEDPAQAALREVREEVGLLIKLVGGNDDAVAQSVSTEYRELLTPVFLNRHRINATHEHVTFVYFGQATTDKIVVGVDEPDCETHWFNKSDLLGPDYALGDDIRHYAEQALARLG